MAEDLNNMDLSMDAAELYLEEVFTDRRVGTVQRLTPVRADGSPDSERPMLYVGQTQLMTRMGPLPLSFEIEATDLADAVARFGEAAGQALHETVRRMEDMRRDAASSLIVPETGGMGGGIPAMGAPGGGKIQLP
ncbi:MAG: hypothetical protein JJT85_06150 [Chromatiales bacterium]|nr:hypothetical protein [Chromatiales bacterium]